MQNNGFNQSQKMSTKQQKHQLFNLGMSQRNPRGYNQFVASFYLLVAAINGLERTGLHGIKRSHQYFHCERRRN